MKRLLQSIQNCNNIPLDPTVSTKDRIEAERLKIETFIKFLGYSVRVQ